MSKDIIAIVHNIKEDGLPPKDGLTGRIAFIWDGAIFSGWPTSLDDPSDPDSMKWESSDSSIVMRQVVGVTHWIELPVPAWELEQS